LHATSLAAAPAVGARAQIETSRRQRSQWRADCGPATSTRLPEKSKGWLL
jgi:hypothetical protein